MTTLNYFGAGSTKTGLIVAYDLEEGSIRAALPCHPQFKLLRPTEDQLQCPHCSRFIQGTVVRELYEEWALEWNVNHRKDWEPPLESLIRDWAAAMLGVEEDAVTVAVSFPAT